MDLIRDRIPGRKYCGSHLRIVDGVQSRSSVALHGSRRNVRLAARFKTTPRPQILDKLQLFAGDCWHAVFIFVL